MKLKELVTDRYQVVAVMDGEDCPAESFLLDGDESTKSYRLGMQKMLMMVAANGLDGIPSQWFHEANKEEQIYEFIKGPFRLFFFKGKGRQIAVCTTAIRKSGQKADKPSVTKAAQWRTSYFDAIEGQTLEVVSDET